MFGFFKRLGGGLSSIWKRKRSTHVLVATYCERHGRDENNRWFIGGIVDSLLIPFPSGGPQQIEYVTALAVVGFKSGLVKGKSKVTFNLLSPIGRHILNRDEYLDFAGDDKLSVCEFPMAIPWNGKGVYLCKIYMDDKIMARIPLRIDFLHSS
jgi:hypothetical protein